MADLGLQGKRIKTLKAVARFSGTNIWLIGTLTFQVAPQKS